MPDGNKKAYLKTNSTVWDTEKLLPIIVRLLNGQAIFDGLYDSLYGHGIILGMDFKLFETALDLLGVPRDNTAETNACDIANATGQWPDDAYCRDWTYDAWDKCKRNPEKFIAVMEKEISKCRMESGSRPS